MPGSDAGAGGQRLEIRATKLAKVLNRHIDTLSTALQPPGSRPPFTTMLSDRKALDWWLQNIDNPNTGGRALANMDEASQLELHNALSEHIRTNLMPGGSPWDA